MLLKDIVGGFAEGLMLADSRMPRARSSRTGRVYQPGIGPHSEPAVVDLVMRELAMADAARFSEHEIGASYPSNPRLKCDLTIRGKEYWAIEVKMARFKGDNGRPADETLMHLISPYEEDRSALTDCVKLTKSGFAGRLAVLIYGFDFDDKCLDPAIDAFEQLARSRVQMDDRKVARFDGLVHPVRRRGRVFGWEIFPS